MNSHQLSLTLTLEEDAFNILVDLLTKALSKVSPKQSESSPVDERRAARLKASQHALFAGEKPPTDRGLLVDTREAVRLLGVSAKTIYTMEKNGQMPKALRIGKAVRWSYEELKAWIAKGCPSLNDQT